MLRTFSLLAVFAFVFGLASDADARSRHERVVVSPMKERGAVVGMRIKMVLRNDDHSGRVLIGIAPKGGVKIDHRAPAVDPKLGHLAYQWKERAAPAYGKAETVTLTVKFKDLKNLKPGDDFEVITAWGEKNYKPGAHHVWGMKSSLMPSPPTYQLPKATKAKAPAKKPAAKKPAAKAKKPAAKKPAAKAKKPAAKKPNQGQAVRAAGSSSTSRSRASQRARTTQATRTARSTTRTTRARAK